MKFKGILQQNLFNCYSQKDIKCDKVSQFQCFWDESLYVYVYPKVQMLTSNSTIRKRMKMGYISEQNVFVTGKIHTENCS